MKTIRNIPLRALCTGITGILVFTGCVRDDIPGPHRKTTEVVFSINVPGNSAPTRALGDGEENEVKTVEMLLFDPSTKNVVGNPVFANAITTDGGDPKKKSFSVRLPAGTFDVMVFANARAAFNGVSIHSGDAQETTLAKLTASMPATGWPTDATNAAKNYLIPMWGRKNNVLIGQGTTISGIYIHRMVSRIDIGVTGTDAQTGNFKIKDVKLYNVQKEGRIAPAAANWNPDGMVNGTVRAGLATAPSTVAGCGVHPAISYAAAIAAGGKSCARGIYIFEAPKAAAHADQNAPYLTVKGEFEGVEGWYRIDLADYSNMTYLDVLRNHFYRIGIAKVTGTGFPDEEDAKKDRGDNIVVDITLWNEYDLGGTAFDGQHFLSVNPQDVELSEDAHTAKTITIKTDVESEVMTLSSIKFSGAANNPNAPLTGNWINNPALSAKSVVNGRNVYTLTYNVAENTSDARTGYIYVKLGRLTNVVRIAQAEGGGTIAITEQVFLPPAIQSPAIQTLAVTCRKNNGDENTNMAWTLTVPAGCGWLTISDSPVANGKTVSGTGSKNIYLFVGSNATGSTSRSVNLTLTSAGTAPLTAVVTQGNTPPANESIETRNSCVGAFWRHDQTGERIVQVNMGSNLGAWTAAVVFHDARWDPSGGDGVLLANDGSADTNVGIEGVIPGNAEDYKLTGYGYGRSISGSVTQSGQNVVFRIGLEKNFAAYSNMPDYYTTFPARYAVVELWYANGAKMQKIYLRQGEGDDYVMPVETSGRPYSKRFSPYNLTAANIDAAAVGIRGGAPNPGHFVDYPSKIGGIFQWGGTVNTRYAYLPYVAGAGAWNNNKSYVYNYWDENLETCPTVGALVYRRPIDDRIAASSDGSRPERSEIRSSLWVTPPSGDNEDNSNSLYGYYADGYYDRHYVDKSGDYYIGVVGAGTVDVATIGRLFYNPGSNASLFLPTSGYRAGENSNYLSVGYVGHYFTSTSQTDLSRAWAFSMRDPASDSYTRMLAIDKTTGGSIRCVRND